MFNFFCNLAIAIYNGYWESYSTEFFVTRFIRYMKVSPIFNMFNNSTANFYETTTFNTGLGSVPDLACTIAVILSAICCISVFFIIVKALKKLFTCFLGE